jgi:hypothetical protein
MSITCLDKDLRGETSNGSVSTRTIGCSGGRIYCGVCHKEWRRATEDIDVVGRDADRVGASAPQAKGDWVESIMSWTMKTKLREVIKRTMKRRKELKSWRAMTPVVKHWQELESPMSNRDCLNKNSELYLVKGLEDGSQAVRGDVARQVWSNDPSEWESEEGERGGETRGWGWGGEFFHSRGVEDMVLSLRLIEFQQECIRVPTSDIAKLISGEDGDIAQLSHHSRGQRERGALVISWADRRESGMRHSQLQRLICARGGGRGGRRGGGRGGEGRMHSVKDEGRNWMRTKFQETTDLIITVPTATALVAMEESNGEVILPSQGDGVVDEILALALAVLVIALRIVTEVANVFDVRI